MPSLRQLRSAHPRLLLVDAASARVQCALWPAGEAPDWRSDDAEAGVAVFEGVAQLLSRHALRTTDLNALIFCEGPGSTLGIRTTAMAVRTWQTIHRLPVFSYRSLDLVAAGLGAGGPHVIADARRDSWHVARAGEPIRRVPTNELPPDVVMPEHFRHWSKLPGEIRVVPYELAELFSRADLLDADLFRPSDSPDAFQHEEPAYATWDAKIHRAPTAR